MCTYADDIASVIKTDVLQNIETILQKQLTKTFKWLLKWEINANVQKSTRLKKGEPPTLILGIVGIPQAGF